MKKNVKVSAAVLAMILALGTTQAFAEDTQDANVSATPISVDAAEDVQAEENAAFISQSGTVESVETTDDGVIVWMDNENGGLRFFVGGTVIVNREDGSYLQADDLTEGMEITVIYDAMAPMGMSMPPYLGEVAAVIANTEAGNIAIGQFDENLFSEKLQLQLNISEDTVIQHVNGARMIFSAEDVKGAEAVVFYDITTRSIPAQTTPSFILLLNTAEEAEAAETQVDVKTTEAVDVQLRSAAEELGYAVEWNAQARTITLTQDDVTAVFTLDSADYTVNGKSMKAEKEVISIDGRTVVSSDVIDALNA